MGDIDVTRKKQKKDSRERLKPAVDKIDELSVESTETKSNKTEVYEDTVGNTKQPEPKSQAVQSEEDDTIYEVHMNSPHHSHCNMALAFNDSSCRLASCISAERGSRTHCAREPENIEKNTLNRFKPPEEPKL